MIPQHMHMFIKLPTNPHTIVDIKGRVYTLPYINVDFLRTIHFQKGGCVFEIIFIAENLERMFPCRIMPI